MPRGSIAAGMALLALGIFVCHQGVQLSLGQASRPGPGFVPFGLGSILILLSALYLVHSLRIQPGEGGGRTRPAVYRTILAAGTLCLFAGVLDWLGYLISTFLLFLLWLLLIERKRWAISIGLSFLALGVVYYFTLLFSIQLPQGLLRGF